MVNKLQTWTLLETGERRNHLNFDFVALKKRLVFCETLTSALKQTGETLNITRKVHSRS